MKVYIITRYIDDKVIKVFDNEQKAIDFCEKDKTTWCEYKEFELE